MPRLRREFDVPIIILTARGEEVDRVSGLTMGADDYKERKKLYPLRIRNSKDTRMSYTFTVSTILTLEIRKAAKNRHNPM